MVEIRELKKRLLKEEKRRQRNSSARYQRLRRLIQILLLLGLLAVVLYQLNRDQILEYRFARAETLYEHGEAAKAAAAYRSLQAADPDHRLAPEALFRAGEILNLNQQQYQEALLVYLLVVRDYPQSRWAQQARIQAAGLYRNRLGDYNQAISLLQKVVDSGIPEADRMQYEIADCYFRLNNFEQARIEFESLQKNFPGSSLLDEVQFRIGMTLVLERNLPAAAEALIKVSEHWPESRFAAEARFQLASVYVEQELLQKALGILKNLRDHYPDPDALELRIKRVEERIRKKKKAI